MGNETVPLRNRVHVGGNDGSQGRHPPWVYRPCRAVADIPEGKKGSLRGKISYKAILAALALHLPFASITANLRRKR